MRMKWLRKVKSANIVIMVQVESDPVAHERPRLGRNGNVYTPEKTAIYKEWLAWQIRAGLPAQTDMEKAQTIYGVQALFFRSNKQRIDVDNLLKTVLDATTMAGVWRDDSQVHEVITRLWTGQNKPGTQFMIYKIEEESGRLSSRYTPNPCAYCGRLIERRSKGYRQKYCSNECRQNASRVAMKCAHCDKPFSILKCQVRNPGSKKSGPYLRQFCSRICSVEFHRTKVLYRERDNWRCEKCGKMVSRKEYKVCRGCSMLERGNPTSNYWKLRHKVSGNHSASP